MNTANTPQEHEVKPGRNVWAICGLIVAVACCFENIGDDNYRPILPSLAVVFCFAGLATIRPE